MLLEQREKLQGGCRLGSEELARYLAVKSAGCNLEEAAEEPGEGREGPAAGDGLAGRAGAKEEASSRRRRTQEASAETKPESSSSGSPSNAFKKSLTWAGSLGSAKANARELSEEKPLAASAERTAAGAPSWSSRAVRRAAGSSRRGRTAMSSA